MKKITQLVKVAMLSVALLIASVGTTKAQYEVGTNVLNLGVGLGSTLGGIGSYGYGSSNSSQTPAIGISFEHGTWEIGDGTISLGGYIGYKAYKYEESGDNWSYTQKLTYTIIGVRGAYHFPLDNEKLDLYLGAMLSYNIVSWKETSTGLWSSYGYANNYTYPSYIGFSAFGGIRYYLTDNIGLNAELGYGISYLTLGVSFKF